MTSNYHAGPDVISSRNASLRRDPDFGCNANKGSKGGGGGGNDYFWKLRQWFNL